MFDFDNINEWSREIAIALEKYVTPSVEAKLAAASPKFIEDSLQLLFDLTNRDAVIDATLSSFRSGQFVIYHGTRLTDNEVTTVQSRGLIILKADDRRQRLVRALSSHAKWQDVSGNFDSVLQAHGRGNRAGVREGSVSLTFSKAGLINGYPHYLTHGAEFDQHVAHALLGPDGVKLLACDGRARIFQVCVPGSLALAAAHPHFSVDDLRSSGEIPNVVREFLEAWSYSLAHKGFQSRTLNADFGLRFNSIVPPEWIVGVETLQL